MFKSGQNLYTTWMDNKSILILGYKVTITLQCSREIEPHIDTGFKRHHTTIGMQNVL